MASPTKETQKAVRTRTDYEIAKSNHECQEPADTVVRSDAPEANIKKVPTLDEIRRRALEIHFERRSHACDMDNYLDEWFQAERELREKYNKSDDQALKSK
jgi:hypothetical protein